MSTSHMFSRPDRLDAPLYVVCTVFNPIRFRSRWKLYEDFARHVAASGAILYTVEIAFGERHFAITEPGNPCHLQLRTNHELWLKENSQNLLVKRLPSDWKYVAFVDADVSFVRGDWANETLHQLQHYKIVQMWTECQDLGPSFEVQKRFKSYAWCLWHLGDPKVASSRNEVPAYSYVGMAREPGVIYWHPGYAWGWRRDALEAVGGLVDWAIIGNADHYMAKALTGDLDKPNKQVEDLSCLGENGRRWMLAWQDRALKYIKQNIGYVDGTITHFWHGHKDNRGYGRRNDYLVASGFDPEKDLKRDSQGLWQLDDNSDLRDGLQEYFRGRNEDEI
jgi:hypothetical protein